jgi:type II secretory pathway pseudopilin PulG
MVNFSVTKSIHTKGFTFLGLLVVIAILGIAMAGVGIVWHQTSQQQNEQQLLYIGETYAKAIGSYYQSNNQNQYPKTLKELIEDKRFGETKRHIRKLYADPMPAHKEWGLVLQNQTIIGVYSQSLKTPIKKSGFSLVQKNFAEAKTYQDWQFVYAPSANKSKKINSKKGS